VDDTWLFVLARDPASAKTRLGPLLSPAARADLAAAMLDDVVAATRDVRFAKRIVVTESAAVRRIARGLDTLDVPPSGTNGAARAALRASDGVRALLLVADVPLLGRSDLEALLDVVAPVVIAPDRHRRGTNALELAPPSVIAPAFGRESFRVHRERAARAQARVRIVRSPGLATDIDSPDDLRAARRSRLLGARTKELLATPAFRRALD
jgi:2-phospho-L-lactate guanylyltransferase